MFVNIYYAVTFFFLLVKIHMQGHMTQDKDNSRITIIQEQQEYNNK
jgi:hypothetical protein